MRIAKGFEPLAKRIALWLLVRRRGARLNPPLPSADLKRIMIYRPERFGDLLATLPVIRALKSHLPDIEVHVWTSPQGRELLEPEPTVDRIQVIAGKSNDRKIARATGTFDLVIDLQMRDSVNALLTCHAAAGDGVLVGWGKDALRPYYDWAPMLESSDEYAMHRGLGVMDLFGLEPPSEADILPAFTDSEMAAVAGLIENAPAPIILNLSAGDRNRRICESVWQQLIEALQSRYDTHIVLNALGADRECAQRLADRFGARVKVAPGNLTFRQAACLITHARLLISADTSLVHIAAAAGVPTVAVYLPRTDWRMSWIPQGVHVHALQVATNALDGLSADRLLEGVDALTLDRRKEATA